MEAHNIIQVKKGEKYFFRSTANQRIQHIILAICVIVLVLTGMPLKFHDASWAHYLYALFGGIKVAPIVHKTTGCILMLLFVYHIIYLAYNIYTGQIAPLRKKKELSVGKLVTLLATLPFIPNRKDLEDIIQLFKYLLFVTDRKPQGDEFTWKNKFDYWAPFWGIPVLGISGLIMWNKEFATHFLPGEIINFALIAHSDEALLAALFLFIWHWYNVHFKTSVFPMGTVFITGYLSEKLMVEDHYEYYVKIMKQAGLEQEILPPYDSFAHESVQRSQILAKSDTTSPDESSQTYESTEGGHSA
ncbi:MAG: cytochrome b/b6 domain-containing protein [Desulfobacterales bacterium]|nr:cytochrome b/b6 domain-containing protein [Desulfobacterales bacterium]